MKTRSFVFIIMMLSAFVQTSYSSDHRQKQEECDHQCCCFTSTCLYRCFLFEKWLYRCLCFADYMADIERAQENAAPALTTSEKLFQHYQQRLSRRNVYVSMPGDTQQNDVEQPPMGSAMV